MKMFEAAGHFDLDLDLRDEAVNLGNSAGQRMLANAAMGVEPEDAYYATRELLEAVREVHFGEPKGKARLASILANDCDDFQRCLYYCLAGRGVVGMMDDLDWLVAKLETRAKLGIKLSRMKHPVLPLSPAYLAACPDGPVPTADPNFREGPSWFLDPDLALLYPPE